MNYPQKGLVWLLDTIFPIRCIDCGDFGDYVCRGCLGAIPTKKSFECIGCKRNTPFGQTCFLCTKTNPADQLLIVADYKNHLVEKTLKFFKYKFISDLEQPLSVLIKKYLKWLTLDKKFNVFESNPLLIPVPLHLRRLNWRGFNQSELLAKNISDTFQMEMAVDVVERTINATPQADIKEREERLKNLNGIFRIKNKEKIIGREVLLVDDVCTTGATLNECAKILKAGGASRVVALVVARG
ncbi:MAG: Phosphoribosyltransferase [Candidatus Yanofskybacteria bacterium GW2011_GWA1_39_13]|uniref:Phosphoribosyltransferase n=1 Tax=Yanofskybacteria sp. (strain GW2011_GWA1_39_13) TaxID=1619019 RepID=A0A0G0MF24_YANXG|nr:MAG: Phosphoribosyltransferase [Candidatus Yanofskybacteria bacterium GW2011_GWA1_39_13]